MIFDPTQENSPDPEDLRGGSRARRRFIGWQTFFDFGDGNMRPNKVIDTKISTPLFNLPLGAIPALTPPAGPPTSLPQRNLLRHVTWQLPSGQSIARHMRVPALSKEDLKELKDFGRISTSPRRCGTTSSRKPRSWKAACILGLSAAASSAKSSSVFSSSTRIPICQIIPVGGPHFRRGTVGSLEISE